MHAENCPNFITHTVFCIFDDITHDFTLFRFFVQFYPTCYGPMSKRVHGC